MGEATGSGCSLICGSLKANKAVRSELLASAGIRRRPVAAKHQTLYSHFYANVQRSHNFCLLVLIAETNASDSHRRFTITHQISARVHFFVLPNLVFASLLYKSIKTLAGIHKAPPPTTTSRLGDIMLDRNSEKKKNLSQCAKIGHRLVALDLHRRQQKFP